MPYKILIAEDDADIVELLRLYLVSEGFEVISAANGADALSLIEKEQPSLAILDIMMPKMNGYELTRAIRERGSLPVLILSAKSMDNDKILGLSLGVDDYLTKPFNPLELVARVKSALRRAYELVPTTGSDSVCSVGKISIDKNNFTCTKGGVQIALTPMEFKILAQLMTSPGRIFTKVQLYEAINGDFFESDDNTMMVHISKLRDKIEDDPKKPRFIKTIRGLGYKIEKE